MSALPFQKKATGRTAPGGQRRIGRSWAGGRGTVRCAAVTTNFGVRSTSHHNKLALTTRCVVVFLAPIPRLRIESRAAAPRVRSTVALGGPPGGCGFSPVIRAGANSTGEHL